MARQRQPREIVAYAGRKFTIEWYYDARGHSQPLEYAEALDDADRKKLAALLMVVGDIGQLRNKQKFRSEGDQIYAFKPKPHRFLAFFFAGGKVIITNAFAKKSDKMSPGEKDRALKCKKDYEERVRAGTYYGKDQE
jgi:phage-related protein